MKEFSKVKVLYPYPMKLSNGYTYMLSILQFLNSLSNYYEVILLSLDKECEIKNYFKNILNVELNKNLKIVTISNKFFFLKSNKLFFFRNLKKYITNNHSSERLLIYSRDLKQMRLCLKKLRKLNRISFAFEVHQILSENYKKKGEKDNANKLERLERFVFGNADFLISITKTLEIEIHNKYDSKARLIVLPVGFNKDFLLAKKNQIDADVIYTGNFSDWKGLDTLIEAVSIIKYTHNKNIRVKLIGARKGDQIKYIEICKKFNVSDLIDIVPRMAHKKILHFLESSLIGVLPNKYLDDGALYTSPLKLYEYLGAGLKVVASRLPSIESNISDSLVYFFEPENPSDLAEKIIYALSDQNFDKHIVQTFARNFTWEARAEKFYFFINENLNN